MSPVGMAAMMAAVGVIELGYDPEAPARDRRLRTIGSVEIRYGVYGPSALGDWPLDYRPGEAHHRLGRVADRDVRYRIWLGQVTQIGDWRVRYGPGLPFLPWPCQIGPFPVERRGPWLRPSRVGPATLRYKPGKTYPSAVVLDPPASELTDDLLFAVAYVLVDNLWRPETSA